MSKSLKFDPITRDLIRNGRGWFTFTENADTTVMHQLLIHRDGAWHDPQIGSDLHNLKAMTGRAEVLAPAEAKRALDVLVARGRISNVEVAAEKQGPGRIVVATKFRDTSTGQILPMKIPAGR